MGGGGGISVRVSFGTGLWAPERTFPMPRSAILGMDGTDLISDILGRKYCGRKAGGGGRMREKRMWFRALRRAL